MTPVTYSARGLPFWVPLVLSAGPLVALGFSRFAYALILPAMGQSLGWSLTMDGMMNTANALGYLLGAIGASPLARRAGLSRILIAGIVVTSLAMVATGITENTMLLAWWRFASGLGGGLAFVAGGGLVARFSARETSNRAGFLLGIYFGGAGIGIVLSAWIVPFLLASFPHNIGWRVAWVNLGGLGLLTLFGVVAALRQDIADVLEPILDSQTPAKLWRLRAVFMAYGLYGAGYIVYMTFIVAFLQHHGARSEVVTWFWTALGGTAMMASFLWGPFLGRASGGRGVAVLMGLVLIGELVPLGSTTDLGFLVSAIFFGSAFLAVVTGVTTVAQRNLPASQWTLALGALTVAFGLGQSVGPLLGGWVSDSGGGVRSGLILGAALLGIGILTVLFQPKYPDKATGK